MELRPIHSEQEKIACRQFWYQIYVEEMGRHTDDASITCHESKTLTDPFDEHGKIIAAFDNDEIVGTVMSLYPRDVDLGYYNNLYKIDSLNNGDSSRTSICTKLMTNPKLRKGSLAAKLAVAIFRSGLKDGIIYNLVDCNEHLIGFFKRLGYDEHLGWIKHKDYGQVYSLRLDLRKNTPLARMASMSKTVNNTRLTG